MITNSYSKSFFKQKYKKFGIWFHLIFFLLCDNKQIICKFWSTDCTK